MKQFCYNREIADEICDRLSEGETLTQICNKDSIGFDRDKNEFPRPATVRAWTRITSNSYDAEFTIQFASACLDNQYAMIDQTLIIADTPEWGEETVEEDAETNGGEKGDITRTVKRVIKKEMLGHRALKIKVRQDALKLLNPGLWSNKLDKAEDDRDVVIHGGLF